MMPRWCDPLETDEFYAAHRPAILGIHGMVSSGHYLATQAAVDILKHGGNAIDAGVAAGLCLNVVQPDMTSLGGVAPVMVYRADANRVSTIDGVGTWPRRATVRYFQEHWGSDLPEGLLQSVAPAAADAWVTALELHGTMSFGEVAAQAVEFAAGGFPVYRFLYHSLLVDVTKYRRWPSTAATLLKSGDPPGVGTLLVQGDLASTLRRMVEAEGRSSGGRAAGLAAARAEFYEGETAARLSRFAAEQGALITREDLRDFRVRLEEPCVTSYRGYTVYSCGPWCQGPVLLQMLNIVEGLDLASLEPNSAEYLHVLLESMKLAFADREAYYGDPRFVDVPLPGLLSKDYAAHRRRAIDLRRATADLPPSGDARQWMGSPSGSPRPPGFGQADPHAGWRPDTSYVCVVDRWGNALSATPSDSAASSPLVPGVGCIISSRGSQSWLDPGHPSAVAPGKRPRLTPNPAMAFRDGRLFLAFGAPGGDTQPQTMLQFFLNIVEFGMDPQTAVERDRAVTRSFPSSWWPHRYSPGAVSLESNYGLAVARQLEGLGHLVRFLTPWERHLSSGLCAVQVTPGSGVLVGAADSRRESYALGW
jgi:gamma-glutamyltranspeptidase/glutathione hydrolase